jgi:hypothetical protein
MFVNCMTVGLLYLKCLMYPVMSDFDSSGNGEYRLLECDAA